MAKKAVSPAAWVTLLFLIWSAGFIYRSSFVAMDGNRYFCLFDDAMISMRYAQNLAHGNGLVWNPGERVEGYSNFLLVLIMAGAQRFFGKVGGVLAVQALGALLLLAIAWAAMRMTKTVAEGRGLPALPLVVFAGTLAYYPLAYWSLMGMETGLLALLVALATLLTLGYRRTGSGLRLYSVALCMGLAFLTRIDALIFCLPLAALILEKLLSGEQPARAALASLRGPAVVFLAFLVGHEIFRVAYYGEWLPNTYALKLTGIPASERVRDGLRFVKPFLFESLVLLALAAFGALSRPRLERLSLLGLGTIGLCYQVWNGGDPWNYWRIMAPGIPYLILLGALALGTAPWMTLAGRPGLDGETRPGNAAAIAAAVVLAAGLVMADYRFREEALLLVPPKYAVNHRNLVNTSIALSEVTTPEATIGIFWAGTPPYFAERNGVDFLGKNDRHVASLPPDTSGLVAWNGLRSVPGHNKYDLEYSVETLLPTYVEAFRWGTQNLEAWAKDHYVTMFYRGQRMHFLKDSPHVRWEKADSLINWESREALQSW